MLLGGLIAYFAIAAPTLWIAVSQQRPGVVWLPDGVAFALLWLAPPTKRLPIAAVIFAGSLALFAQHYPFPSVALLTIIPVLRNLLMVTVLRHLQGHRPLLGSWLGTARFIVVSLLTAALMAPVMALPDFLAGRDPLPAMALTGGTFAMGTVAIAPSLLITELDPAAQRRPLSALDLALGIGFLTAIGAVLLGLVDIEPLRPARFLAVAPFIWLVWRFRVRGAAIGIAALAGIAATSATAGLGQFGDGTGAALDRAFTAQLFIASFAVSGLGLGSLLEEQAVRAEAPASLRSLLDGSAEGVIIRSVEGNILYLNPAAERVFEAEPGAVVGQPLHRFLAPEEAGQPGRQPRIDLGASGFTELDLVTVRGNRRRLHAFGTPLRDETDRPFAVLTTVRPAGADAPVLGAFVAESRLRALATSIETAREAERSRISRELHDELGQALVGMALDLKWLRTNAIKPDVLLRLEAMQRTLDHTTREVRRLTSELRPALLDDLGLVDAIEWQAKMCAERAGLALELDLPAQVSLDRDRATAVFRIAQEALTNVARHAAATRVAVSMTATTSHLDLVVQDDGIGFGDSPDPSSGFGLLGMRERALTWGGAVLIEAAPGGGTRVSLQLPLPRTTDT